MLNAALTVYGARPYNLGHQLDQCGCDADTNVLVLYCGRYAPDGDSCGN